MYVKYYFKKWKSSHRMHASADTQKCTAIMRWGRPGRWLQAACAIIDVPGPRGVCERVKEH
jgi:hypothetical protein